MRLLTHNILSSQITGVTNNYPLKIEAKKVIVLEDKFEPDYLKLLFTKINWGALVYASKELGYTELPNEVPDASVLDSDEFLKKFHHALLELHLYEGALLCPETGRRFPVEMGAPDMALREDETLLSDEEPKESKKKEPTSMEIEGSSIDKQTQILPSDDKSNKSKKTKPSKKKRWRMRNKQKQMLPADCESMVRTDIDRIAIYKPKVMFVDMSSDSSCDEFGLPVRKGCVGRDS